MPTLSRHGQDLALRGSAQIQNKARPGPQGRAVSACRLAVKLTGVTGLFHVFGSLRNKKASNGKGAAWATIACAHDRDAVQRRVLCTELLRQWLLRQRLCQGSQAEATPCYVLQLQKQWLSAALGSRVPPQHESGTSLCHSKDDTDCADHPQEHCKTRMLPHSPSLRAVQKGDCLNILQKRGLCFF